MDYVSHNMYYNKPVESPSEVSPAIPEIRFYNAEMIDAQSRRGEGC